MVSFAAAIAAELSSLNYDHVPGYVATMFQVSLKLLTILSPICNSHEGEDFVHLHAVCRRHAVWNDHVQRLRLGRCPLANAIMQELAEGGEVICRSKVAS